MMIEKIIITDYEVMFTIHTGVTILIPKTDAFNKISSDNIYFQIDQDNIKINTLNDKLLITKVQKNYLEAAAKRGFIMFYEIENDEVVRCTPCKIKTS